MTAQSTNDEVLTRQTLEFNMNGSGPSGFNLDVTITFCSDVEVPTLAPTEAPVVTTTTKKEPEITTEKPLVTTQDPVMVNY